MTSNNFTSSEIRQLEKLFKSRSRLLSEVASIDDRVAAIWSKQMAPQNGNRKDGGRSSRSLSPKSGSKHGALKTAILKVLKKAGKKGRTVRELSDDVGVLSANIHVWFSTTGKRIDGLEKIGEARWRYVG